ncbi:MAG: hypothetical protein JNL58_02765 [Planctomyces sp.]|nr:hypothetical protein [Planctomyces sp.]
MSVQDSMRQFKAGVFQALSHPTRIFIIETIGRREMTVGQLSESPGRIAMEENPDDGLPEVHLRRDRVNPDVCFRRL